MNAPDVAELYQLPCPPRAILLGKGPSLDHWTPPDQHDPLCPVWGCNEAGLLPCADFFIYRDHHFEACVPANPQAIILRPKAFDRHHAGTGYALVGLSMFTAVAALQVMGTWGIRDVLMVGFDGLDRSFGTDDADLYASSLTLRSPRHPYQGYDKINESLLRAIEEHGLRPVWFHRSLPALTATNGS